MKPDYLDVRDWKCLEYCETKENCLYACGLVPPHEAIYGDPALRSEIDPMPISFTINPAKLQGKSKELTLV